MSHLLQDSLRAEQLFASTTGPQAESARSPSASQPQATDSSGQLGDKPPRSAQHWTKRLRDPLGDALARIKSHGQPRLVATETVSESQALPSLHRDRSSFATHSEDAKILSMYDARQISEVEDSTPSDSNNRRKFPRRQSECRVAIARRSETTGLTPQQIDWLLESGRAIGHLKNLSQLGICLLLATEMAAETEVLLRITNEKLGRYVDISAQVVGSHPAPSGIFLIHCRTLRDFTLDELQDLGQPISID